MKNKVTVKMKWAGYNGATNKTYWKATVIYKGRVVDLWTNGYSIYGETMFYYNGRLPKTKSGLYKKIRKIFENR